MSDLHTETPEELKKAILRKSGSQIPDDLPLEDAMGTGGGSGPTKSEPGDDDPSREIGSAEVVMTFDGKSNGGSANIGPYLKKNLEKIAARINHEDPLSK